MFELAWKIAVKEMARNKMRLLVACLISLILFLAAFILINLSYSLPVNFYKYYEEFFPSDLTLKVTNADRALIDKSETYFEYISIENDFIKERFELFFGDKSFAYLNKGDEADNPNVVHKYKSAYTSEVKLDELFKNEKISPEDFLLNGTLWHDDLDVEYNTIWLSDKVATALGISDIISSNGETINVNLALDIKNDNDYVSETYAVAGIYSYDEYLKVNSSPPVMLMTEEKANDIYFANFTTYNIVGRVGNVSRLYDIYNSLIKNYSLSDSVQVDMLIAVKNAEAICAIIGVCMLIGGLIVLMNFISMFISTNRKGIGLMTALGARSASVTIGYGIIFAFMLLIIGLITLIIIPSVNLSISKFIFYIGYNFEITTNYWLLLGLYIISNIGMALIMLYENVKIKRLTPIEELKEED